MIIKMKAKFDSKCAEYSTKLYEDDNIFYDTEEQKAYCEECGEEL